MRSEAQLDSAVFQLTPTRTRCDLVIISNGKQETLASGLLNPFVTHLKIAQDQIAKGGYSIILEPDPEVDAAWFTKGTVERFVRFVSTPEVLERVTDIELEILQIDNAITIQSSDNFGLHVAADHQLNPAEATKGIKTSDDVDEEKAIVLYKPGSESNQPDSNGSTRQENSKVQLFRVLEIRKMVLCKEQGMAFARAAAAGFDMDKMVDLISFAESFGATRLKEACINYVELWKKKHETGQWLEVESSEAMSMRSEFSTLNANAAGIVFAADSMIQKDHGDAQSISGGDIVTDNHGKVDVKMSIRHQEHSQGQHQHPTYPQWSTHPPTGHSVFQSYYMQGMPYYHNYLESIPYFHPACPPMEDPRFDISQRKGSKRLSIDNKDIKHEACGSSTRSQDDTDESTSDLEVDGSHDHKSHKSVGQAGKKKSNVVVIENLNYIASKKNGLGESESKAQSDFETEVRKENEGSHSYIRENKNTRQAKEADEYFEAYNNEKAAHGGEADSGNWQAFQNFLLRADEKSRRVDEDMFDGEKEHPSKRKQSKGEADPVVPPKRGYGDFHDQRMVGFDSVNGKNGKTRRMKQAASDDPVLVSRNGVLTDNQIKGVEISGEYRVKRSDEFMIYDGHRKQFNSKRFSDPCIDHRDEQHGNAMTSSSHKIRDESFMLPYRSRMQDTGSGSQTTIDMDSEFPSALQKAKDPYDNVKNQFIHEPSDLVPERGNESLSVGYDPAIEYDLAVPFGNSIKLKASKPEVLSTSTKEAYKKSNKEKNLISLKDSKEKRRKDAAPLKQGLSSRLNPLTAAQKRAENLRIYKVDLQKAKKEMEEEQKRLEALKRDKQKRISSRSSSTATQFPLTSQQTKAHLTTKPLPSTYKSSKFRDSQPVSSSPFRKLPVRTSSTGSSDHQKATKPSRINGSSHGLARSTSSLPVPKKGSNGLVPETKANSLRTKRVSDPKSSYIQHNFSVKSMASKQLSQRSIPDESQKKLTAIMQLDQSKSATLPEIRVKTNKASTKRIDKDSSGKDTLNKGSGSKAFQASGAINGKKVLKDTVSNRDESLITEKTFMMHENNVFTAPISLQSGKMLDIKENSEGDGLLTSSEVIDAPPSPVVMAQAEDSGQSKLDKQPNTCQVEVPYSRNEPQKLFNSIVTEKPHQTPYTSATSLNDSLPINQGHARDRLAPESATVAARIMNFEKLSLGDQTPEAHEKHRKKETRGLRKLLKFARRSHSSVAGEGNVESDASSVDDQTTSAGSSNDVHILKNLISQEDTGGTPAKVSLPFSLLSPFRSKNSERNLIT